MRKYSFRVPCELGVRWHVGSLSVPPQAEAIAGTPVRAGRKSPEVRLRGRPRATAEMSVLLSSRQSLRGTTHTSRNPQETAFGQIRVRHRKFPCPVSPQAEARQP